MFSVEHLRDVDSAQEPIIDSLQPESRTLVGPDVSALLETMPSRQGFAMSPATIATRTADKGWASGRRRVGEKHLEVADVVASEDGEAINVRVGLCVLDLIDEARKRTISEPRRRALPAHAAEQADRLHPIRSVTRSRRMPKPFWVRIDSAWNWTPR